MVKAGISPSISERQFPEFYKRLTKIWTYF